MDYMDYMELWEDYYEQPPHQPEAPAMEVASPELQLHTFENTLEYNGLMASLAMGNLS